MTPSDSGQGGPLIVRIFGGLGNQLFIYAFAKHLASKNNLALKLDIDSGFQDDPYKRHYCLKHFQIEEEFASTHEAFCDEAGEKRRYWARKINRLLPLPYKWYHEQQQPYEERLLKGRLRRRLYLQGYWQDERYFTDSAEAIRHHFTITSPHSEQNQQLARHIKNQGERAICLHARRLNYEHALSKDYYQRALDHVCSQVSSPHFYCFADDPSWFKELHINHPLTIIDHNGEDNNYEDLWLMTKCSHYIIANSTFSWWGAWLNPKPTKIVIAPAQWGYDTTIPPNWLAL